MKFQALAAALLAVSSAAHADDAEIRSMAFDTLQARFSYGTSLKANSELSSFIGSTLFCVTVFKAPGHAHRNAPWDPMVADAPIEARSSSGSISLTVSGNSLTLDHNSSSDYMSSYRNIGLLDVLHVRNYSESFGLNSESPLVIVDSGVSIQLRQAADENGTLLMRIHNYGIEHASREAFRPEGFSVCRSLSRLTGPL